MLKISCVNQFLKNNFLRLCFQRVHHELHQLVQAVPVKLTALDEVVILDVLQNQFPIALALPHPVPSHPVRTPGGFGGG